MHVGFTIYMFVFNRNIAIEIVVSKLLKRHPKAKSRAPALPEGLCCLLIFALSTFFK